MRRCISKRGADQDPLLPLPTPCGALYIVEVVVSHSLELCIFVRGQIAKGAGAQVRSQIGKDEVESSEEDRAY